MVERGSRGGEPELEASEASDRSVEDHSTSTTDPDDFRSLAITGGVWTFFHYGGSQIVRLAGNVVLTRLLFPEAFGLMAMIQLLLYGLSMFSDVGIRDSIVRSERGDDRDFLDTGWTLQVILGGVIWLTACALAVPYALFYRQPELREMIPFVAISAVFLGFGSTKALTLDRHVRRGRMVGLELGTQLVGLALTIALAAIFHSVWALAIGSTLSALLRTIATFLFRPGPRNRFRLELPARREIFRYGRWIVMSSALTFFAQSLDLLVFGKLSPLEVLGLYSIGKNLATAPAAALTQVADRVVFPIYSRLLSRESDLRSVFDRGRKPLLVLTGWVLTLFIAGGQPLIDLLYDPRYRGAGLVVQSLAVASWFHMLEVVNGSALKALGSPKWLAVATAVKIAVLSIGLPLGVWLGGMSGGLVALVIGDAAKWLVSSYAMSRHQLPVWRAVLPTTGWVGVSAALTSALVAWSEWGPSRALLVVLVVASSCWAVPGWRTLRALRS